MKKIVLLFVLISGYAFSQSVNDYEYVIVPAKFDFFKKEDQFRLNNLTKLILLKYGFKAFLSNEEIPVSIENQRCNFLYANVLEDSGMMLTKVKIVLKDCREKLVFETEYGKSREKEFGVAYNEALRETTKSFEKLNYKYNGKNDINAMTVVTTKESENNVPTSSPNTISSETNQIFYFAQPIANGYQVVDSEPKIIMKLFNTSQKNVFMAVKGDINGTVISKNGEWFFEYYENGKLVSELLKLKF